MAYPYDSDGTVKAVEGTNCLTESVSAWYNKYSADLEQAYSMYLLNPACKFLDCFQVTGNGLSVKTTKYDPSGIGPDKGTISNWLCCENFVPIPLDTEVRMASWRNQMETGATFPQNSYLSFGTGASNAYTISWRDSFPIIKAKANNGVLNSVNLTNTVDTPATVTLMVKNASDDDNFNLINNTSPNVRLTYTSTGLLSASADNTVLSGNIDFSSDFTLFTYILNYGNYALYRNDEDDPIARGNLGSVQRNVIPLLNTGNLQGEGLEIKELLVWDIDVRNKYDIKTFRQDILKRFTNGY